MAEQLVVKEAVPGGFRRGGEDLTAGLMDAAVYHQVVTEFKVLDGMTQSIFGPSAGNNGTRVVSGSVLSDLSAYVVACWYEADMMLDQSPWNHRRKPMIVVTAVMSATPGNGDALVKAMKAMAVEVEKEPGNHCYLVHQSVDNADTVLIYEQYTDQDALAVHREHLKELGGGLKGLLSGRPDVRQFTLES